MRAVVRAEQLGQRVVGGREYVFVVKTFVRMRMLGVVVMVMRTNQ